MGVSDNLSQSEIQQFWLQVVLISLPINAHWNIRENSHFFLEHIASVCLDCRLSWKGSPSAFWNISSQHKNPRNSEISLKIGENSESTIELKRHYFCSHGNKLHWAKSCQRLFYASSGFFPSYSRARQMPGSELEVLSFQHYSIFISLN